MPVEFGGNLPLGALGLPRCNFLSFCLQPNPDLFRHAALGIGCLLFQLGGAVCYFLFPPGDLDLLIAHLLLIFALHGRDQRCCQRLGHLHLVAALRTLHRLLIGSLNSCPLQLCPLHRVLLVPQPFQNHPLSRLRR